MVARFVWEFHFLQQLCFTEPGGSSSCCSDCRDCTQYKEQKQHSFCSSIHLSSDSLLYKSHPVFLCKKSRHVDYLILWCTIQITLHNQRCCIQSCLSTSWASNSPDSSHPFLPGASPFLPSQLRLHGVIFKQHRDAGPDKCQQYAGGRTRPRRAPSWHQITTISSPTGFHSELSRSTALVSGLMKALKWWFITYPYLSLFVSFWRCQSLLYFCFYLAAKK